VPIDAATPAPFFPAALRAGGRTSFVGRDAEIARLRERLATAAEGQGGVTLIAGEPGVGKTRIARELASSAHEQGWDVLYGRAYETQGMPTYMPFVEALEDVVDQPDVQAPSPQPTIEASDATTVAAMRSPFRLSQGIFDFVPGAGSGAHSHLGPGIVIALAGEMTQRNTEGDIKQEAGEVLTEVPGRPVDHRNFGPQVATVATSYLIPIGSPAAVPATLAGSPPLVTVPAAPTPTPVPSAADR
jgi:quercetin dioxygenase-like cupin family protein